MLHDYICLSRQRAHSIKEGHSETRSEKLACKRRLFLAPKHWCVCETGLVETSTNLASVKPGAAESGARPDKYLIQCSTRSSLGPVLEAVRDSIAKLSGLVIQLDS